MICAGTREACSRTSSFLLHSLIINPLSFMTAIHFGISLIYSPRQLHILSLQERGKPSIHSQNEGKNEFTARRTIVINCLRHSKSSPQSQPDMETQRMLSPPEAGILSSWKTSSSAFLGHHSISQSPCRISFWPPTKQNRKCDTEHEGPRAAVTASPWHRAGWQCQVGANLRQDLGAAAGSR